MGKRSKKDNFNQAMYEMFGVGKNTAVVKETEAEEEIDVVEEVAAKIAAEPVEQEAPAAESAAPTESESAAVQQVEEIVVSPVATTYLAPGTTMEGTLHAAGNVEIAGQFKGDIVAEGDVIVRADILGNITARNLQMMNCTLHGDATTSGILILSEESVVRGNVKADELDCRGRVDGDLVVQNNMMLGEKAFVTGNVSTGTMVMARGAVLKGKVEMLSNK